MQDIRGRLLQEHTNTEYHCSRAPWCDHTAIGQGFDRITAQFRPVAITFTPKQLPDPVVAPSFQYKVTDDVQESAEFLSNGFKLGASVPMWGSTSAHSSASRKFSQNLKSTKNSQVAMLRMQFVSEPRIAIQPADASSNVQLTTSAGTLLKEQGPLAFHDKFGTHYVSGHTFGARMPCLGARRGC